MILISEYSAYKDYIISYFNASYPLIQTNLMYRMPEGDIELVIIHEMGHVLGIGTFWNERCGKKCSKGVSSYTCEKASEEYKALGYEDSLEIQADVCGHWSESNFGFSRDEIMTPYFDEGKYQPISRITAAALFDLGYEINFNATDPWNSGGRMVTETNGTGIVAPTTSFVLDEQAIIKPMMLDL